MKKLVLASFIAASMAVLTSCLDGGSNENTGVVYGVVEYDIKTFRNLVYFSDADYPMFANNLGTSIDDGECCLMAYTMRGEDNPDVATTGYYNVTGSYIPIDKYTANDYLVDTTKVWGRSEQATTSFIANSFVKNYLFITTNHAIGANQKNTFSLSYNYDQVPTKESGKDVYNLFLRVTKTVDATSTAQDTPWTNAYNIGSFINQISNIEKNKGNKEYNFKVNYVKSFSTTDSIPSWGASDVITFKIPEES